MPIFFRAGGPSNCPRYSLPISQKMAGRVNNARLKPEHIAQAKTILSRLAGGSYLKPLEPGTGGGQGEFKFDAGMLMYEGKPFLTARDIDAANVAGKVFPIVLISAILDMNEAWQCAFSPEHSARGEQAKVAGFTSEAQFTSYAERISTMVRDHLLAELGKIRAFSGHEVKVAVGLDMTSKPILMIDII